ncbi:hypothetical protein GWN26_07175 [Candidatus Saccharibacteria bacterium]|nr:hypothetical protein [Candidatus Saccharibacteria bacterium]
MQHRTAPDANFCNIEPARTQTFATQSLKTLNNKDLANDSIPFEQRQQTDNQHNQLWQDVLDQLQFQMTKAIFITWLKNTQLIDVVGQSYTIAVESKQAKEWLEHRLKRTVARALAQVVGEDDIQVAFVVRNSQSESPEMGK